MKKQLNKSECFLIVTILDLLVTFMQFLNIQRLYIDIGENIVMGFEKIGLNKDNYKDLKWEDEPLEVSLH